MFHLFAVARVESIDTMILSEILRVKKTKFHQVILGGDQLTAACARPAIKNIGNGNRLAKKL